MKFLKKKGINILNVTFKNNDELKELLRIIGYSISQKGEILNDGGFLVLNSEGLPIKYKNVGSVLPGSKVVIEKNDLTAVTRYFNTKFMG